ncbi:unnamed protein product [Trichogramma brassicae]|uniref:Uncharacterized protein n=1 Tax=Trichogramma brassicae TaxID=86971 RepID=A0A6H5ILU2_9HYME|nr:unnamed protein product [Trichogramma brassicae]
MGRAHIQAYVCVQYRRTRLHRSKPSLLKSAETRRLGIAYVAKKSKQHPSQKKMKRESLGPCEWKICQASATKQQKIRNERKNDRRNTKIKNGEMSHLEQMIKCGDATEYCHRAQKELQPSLDEDSEARAKFQRCSAPTYIN